MRRRLIPPSDWPVPSGFCECGCGQRTTISANSKPERGEYFGYPLRYVHGHNATGRPSPKPKREQSPKWRGGRIIDSHGYVLVYSPGHRLANTWGYVLEHRITWENAHGPLQPGQVVHHIDGDKQNNAPENLVALTQADHARQHGRHITAQTRKRLSDAAKRQHAEGREKRHQKMPITTAKVNDGVVPPTVQSTRQ